MITIEKTKSITPEIAILHRGVLLAKITETNVFFCESELTTEQICEVRKVAKNFDSYYNSLMAKERFAKLITKQSRKELAKKIGVNYNTLCKTITGERQATKQMLKNIEKC